MKTLKIWTGPVSSEKTTKALYAAKRLARRGRTVVLIRPPNSRRAHEDNLHLVTKGGEQWPCVEVIAASDIEIAASGADVIWLDEPFMFEDQQKLYATVRRLLVDHEVMVSTITATSELEPISASVSALLAIADEIHHCRADCDDCQQLNNATRSWHLAGPKLEKVKTGGAESYEPKCARCWTRRSPQL